MNQKVYWVVENGGGNRESADLIKKSLKKKDIPFRDIGMSFFWSKEKDTDKIFPNDYCVVTYGSIVFNNSFNNKWWIPGNNGETYRYHCSSYYSYFQEYLLNHDHLFFPIHELQIQWDLIQKYLNTTDKIYMRPNYAHKPFTGQLIEKQHIQEFIDAYIEPLMVVVSSPKKIDEEWRVLICDREVICATPYLINDELVNEQQAKEKTINPKIIELAEKIAQIEWRPDNFFILDVAMYQNNAYLIEINRFNTSGLYYIDTDLVVEKISQAALKEYKEEWDI